MCHFWKSHLSDAGLGSLPGFAGFRGWSIGCRRRSSILAQNIAGDVLNEKVTIFEHQIIKRDGVIHVVIGLTISLPMPLIQEGFRRWRKALNYAHPRADS